MNTSKLLKIYIIACIIFDIVLLLLQIKIHDVLVFSIILILLEFILGILLIGIKDFIIYLKLNKGKNCLKTITEDKNIAA